MRNVKEQVKGTVTTKLDSGRVVEESEIWQIIDDILQSSEYRNLGVHNRIVIRKEIFNDIKRLDILQELLEDQSISEIMVNGPENIFIEKDGQITKWTKSFCSKEALCDVIQRIAANSNKIINESLPISDTRLSDGSRVNVVMNPVAIDGPIVTIRKFQDNIFSMDRLIDIGSITEEAADFLKKLVRSGYNIFISGGTGSGKTTFLNALSDYIPKDERIITIEDSAELSLRDVPNLVRLEARNANIEGGNAITIRDLIKSSLRMRPDRIIVGEIRGAEAIDMLQVMNTGHDGSLSTGHANSAADMITRIETMVLMGMDMPIGAIRNQILSAIDIIVHVGRLRDKSRKVLSICEVEGMEGEQIALGTLYRFEEEGFSDGKVCGTLKRTETEFRRNQKYISAGY